MKYCLLIFILSFPILLFAQKDSVNQSLLEKFSNKSGSLIRKEYLEIGKISGLEIDLMIIKNLSDPQFKQISGCRIDYQGQYSSYHAFIDIDELGALMSAIQIIQTNIFIDTTSNYTEVNFKSRSGFQAGCYNDKKSKEWSPFVQVVSYSDKSLVFLNQTEFARFGGYIQTVINRLK